MAVEPLAAAIAGGAGRMGKTLIAMLAERKDLRLVCALEHADHPQLGQDSGELAGVAANGVALKAKAEESERFDALIDFSAADAASANLRLCLERKCALVLGATGWGETLRAELQNAASEIPIVCAPNMSAGVNLFLELLRIAGAALGTEADIEISETHHRQKKDAPSGTALRMGEILADARGQTLENSAVHGRHGADIPRKPGEIGFSVQRGGKIAGEHIARFISDAEELQISHRAFDRSGFAAGALRAALWLRERPPGLYDMRDVLGLSER